MRTRLALLLVGLLVAIPLAAWGFFKPLRVLAPTLAGVQCPAPGLCVDDPSQLHAASELKAQAVAFVEAKLGPMREVPRMVFCTTQACADAFGFTTNAGYTVATLGVMIAPRGWKPHYVRHELIHHVQMERLGSWHAELFTPAWFIEGMAYSMSDDPRRPLPGSLEGQRARFEAWLGTVGPENLWAAAAAAKLRR